MTAHHRLVRGIVAAMVAMVSWGGVAGVGVAGELIVDPDNPGVDGSDETDDGDNEDEDKAGGEDDGLLIEDPERPELPDHDDESEDEDDAELVIDEPERPEEADEPETGGGEFRETQWDLDYRVTTLVHPRIGPVGRDAAEMTGEVGMALRHQASPRTRAVLAGRLRYWSGAGERFDDWRTDYEPRLERGYLIHRRDEWSFAVGQMTNSWGSTDIVRPGDVIDPVDLRNPLGGERFGGGLSQLSATATYGGDDWSVQGVVVPFFESNRISLFGRDTSLAHERNPIIGEQLPFLLAALELTGADRRQEIQPMLQATEPPRDLPQNASGGLRGSWTVSGTDLGLGAYLGWDRSPIIEFDEELEEMVTSGGDGPQNSGEQSAAEDFDELVDGDGTALGSRFVRRLTVLADGARYVGPIGVRADVAFSPRQVFYTSDLESVRRPSLFSALGLSYERLLGGVRPLALTLEGYWLQPMSADSVLTEALVPADQRGEASDELLMIDGGYYGVVGLVNWATDWWDLELSSGMVASISPGDVIGQLAVERSWRSGVTTRLGTNLFVGPSPDRRMTLGGLWAHGNRVYLSVGGQF